MQMSSNRLRNASNAFFITAQEWRQDQGRAQALLHNLGRMLNSQEQFEVDDSFNVNVVHVQARPRGSGKGTLLAWISILSYLTPDEKIAPNRTPRRPRSLLPSSNHDCCTCPEAYELARP